MRLLLLDSQTAVQLVIEKALARRIGLKPLAINHQLGDSTLADTAHQLAGNCGMLGFERLAYVARQFEDAARIAPAKAAALADDIGAALEATIKEIDDRAAVGLEARSDPAAVS